MGSFDNEYLSQFDVALVRRAGEIVAFANLWSTGTKRELSVDLMRFGPNSPRSAMDFLFAELMLWGRAQGYGWFNLGMAPFDLTATQKGEDIDTHIHLVLADIKLMIEEDGAYRGQGDLTVVGQFRGADCSSELNFTGTVRSAARPKDPERTRFRLGAHSERAISPHHDAVPGCRPLDDDAVADRDADSRADRESRGVGTGDARSRRAGGRHAYSHQRWHGDDLIAAARVTSMQLLQPETMRCPYCGEQIDVLVDCSAGSQEYVEDCSVCCRPIVVRLAVEDGELVGLEGRSENE